MRRTAQSLFTLSRTRRRAIRSAAQLHNDEPRSADALPVELLLKVFEQLDRNALSACMRVCWRWYGIASPCFFAVVPVRYSHRQPFTKHFRAHPELVAYVQELHFFDKSWGDSGDWEHFWIKPRPFDVQLLASRLPLFTNLARLSITGCDNKADLPQVLRRMTRRTCTPVPLRRLTLRFCGNIALILHGLFSLFSVDTLMITMGFMEAPSSHQMSATCSQALIPPASIALQNLVVQGSIKHLFDFLGRVLAPGKLRGLAISPSELRQDEGRSLHCFLRSPAAQNLLSVTSSCRRERLYHPPPNVPETPLVYETLGAAIAECSRIQYLRLGLVNCPPGDKIFTGPGLRTLCPLPANLPSSLRAFSLHIWIPISPPAPCGWARAVGSWPTVMKCLAALDRALDPAGVERRRRLQHLRRIELHVHFWDITMGSQAARDGHDAEERERQGDIERVAAAMPLPRLKAAGLLHAFRVDSVVHGPEECELVTDMYWPSDSEI